MTQTEIELKSEAERLREILRELMSFGLETYYPACATPEYKAAVEAAKKELFDKS